MAIREVIAQGAADRAPFEAEAAVVDALVSSEQRFRLAFEQSMAGTILVDLEDKVLEVNDTFCQMVGRNSSLCSQEGDYTLTRKGLCSHANGTHTGPRNR